MSHLLILYGTTDGHTAKIAAAMGQTLRDEGCTVDVVNAADPGQVRPMSYDGVVVAASVHAGGYQRPVVRWVAKYADELGNRPTAFVSVCLGVLEKNTKTTHELERILNRFEARARWHPGAIKMVAGALPYTRYGWIKKWVMKRIVRRAGGDTDTTRDYEYTDWKDLRAFTVGFVRQWGLIPGLPVTRQGCCCVTALELPPPSDRKVAVSSPR